MHIAFLSLCRALCDYYVFYQRDRKNSNWRASQINLATGFSLSRRFIIINSSRVSALAYQLFHPSIIIISTSKREKRKKKTKREKWKWRWRGREIGVHRSIRYTRYFSLFAAYYWIEKFRQRQRPYYYYYYYYYYCYCYYYYYYCVSSNRSKGAWPIIIYTNDPWERSGKRRDENEGGKKRKKEERKHSQSRRLTVLER